jgi:DNA invertase Pin-like site-specific DNA recombinase
MIYTYYRRSTQQQELSVERQQRIVADWAKKNNKTIDVEYIEDPVSGASKLKDRPALSALMANIQKGDVVVCSDITRLSRNTMVFNMILGLVHNADATIIFADGHQVSPDDLMSMLMTSILAWTSQWEREQISTRTKQALSITRTKRALGREDRCQYGFRNIDGRKVPHKEEQRVGNLISSMRAQGSKLKEVKMELDRQNITTRTGRSYTVSGISHLCRTFEAA